MTFHAGNTEPPTSQCGLGALVPPENVTTSCTLADAVLEEVILSKPLHYVNLCFQRPPASGQCPDIMQIISMEEATNIEAVS